MEAFLRYKADLWLQIFIFKFIIKIMMKKFLPFLLVLLLLFSCKKDKSADSISSLNGKWATGGYDFELYDASGMVVSHSVADAIETYWTFEKSQLTLSYVLKPDVITSGYKVLNNATEKRLLIDNSNIAGQTQWKIEAQTDQLIKISTAITDPALLHSSAFRTAVRGVKTIYLIREK